MLGDLLGGVAGAALPLSLAGAALPLSRSRRSMREPSVKLL
jgi:hypothetical protein